MSESISILITAINEVMQAVTRVKKTGINQHHRYKYASEEDLLEAIRPAMVRAGLVMYPIKVTILGTEPIGKNTRIDISVIYNLRHKSGAMLEVCVCSSGIDGQDKALPKAMTMALKYAIIQTFLIPRSENDPDARPPLWQCNKSQFLAFATIHGGELGIYDQCNRNGWPHPETWNQDRLENFMAAVNRGEILIGGGDVEQ